MEVHSRNRGHPRLDVSFFEHRYFQRMVGFEFSYRENRSYEHRVKYVMMKGF